MKVSVLFLAIFATASAQTEPWCRCAAFVTYEHSEIMVFEEPEIAIDSCDNQNQCKNRCISTLNDGSNNGDLWYVDGTSLTIGQQICTYLADHWFFFVHNHKVYGYYEVCGGAWQYAGVESQQMLCCNGGKHEHCVSH